MLALGILVSAEIKHKMAHRICRVLAVSKHIVEGLEAGDSLILTKGDQQIGKFMLRNFKLAHRFCQRDKYRMLWRSLVTGVKFTLPLIEKFERGGCIADFIAEIVRDPAVRVHVVKVLTQPGWKKPCGNGEIFVMRAGKLGAVSLSLFEARCCRRDRIARRKAAPAEGCRILRCQLGHG